MATEPGKIFFPNYIIQYFFRIQNLEGGADRVDKKEGPGLSGPGVHGTPKFWQISQPYLNQRGGGGLCRHQITTDPPDFLTFLHLGLEIR